MHGSPTDATELGILVPVEQFMALACQSVVSLGEFVVALAQSAHLIVFKVGQWTVYAVCLDIFNIHDGGPWFHFSRLLCGYLIVAVYLLKDKVALTKNKVFHALMFYFQCLKIIFLSRSMAGRAHTSGMKRQLLSAFAFTCFSRSIFFVR